MATGDTIAVVIICLGFVAFAVTLAWAQSTDG